MKTLLVVALFSAASLSSYYNERHFEGRNAVWKTCETVQPRLEIIRQFLPLRPVVFEAGAMNGEDSVKLAMTWPSGKIISFEPNPNQFKFYAEKAKYFPNMYGYNLAVHTYNGEATFYLCWGTGGKDPIFEGASSLLKASPAMEIHYMGREIQVPCVVLDDWCAQNGVDTIDFMWLDLEGFELQLLKSSPEIVKTVRAIYTETNFFEFRDGTTQFSALKTYLESQGFTMIAHWYSEGLQGDAIFVRNELL